MLPNCGIRKVDNDGTSSVLHQCWLLLLEWENSPCELAMASSSTNGCLSARGTKSKNLKTGLFVLPESPGVSVRYTQKKRRVFTQSPLLGIHKQPRLRMGHAPHLGFPHATFRRCELDWRVVQDLGFNSKGMEGRKGVHDGFYVRCVAHVR